MCENFFFIILLELVGVVGILGGEFVVGVIFWCNALLFLVGCVLRVVCVLGVGVDDE